MVSIHVDSRRPCFILARCSSSLRHDLLSIPRSMPDPPLCRLAWARGLACALRSMSCRSASGMSTCGFPVSCKRLNSQVSWPWAPMIARG
eukprot:6868614-Pyramimonas_sp.AAC.2